MKAIARKYKYFSVSMKETIKLNNNNNNNK